jgi:hypothetical protein
MMYKDVLPNIKYVLGLIKKTFNTKCAPQSWFHSPW